MKIAFIILIHEYNEQQKKLIKHLSKDFDVYVHIDKKLNINIEDIDYKNVFAFKEYKVYWGSFNQICATLLLYKEANKNKYDRLQAMLDECDDVQDIYNNIEFDD